MAGATRVRGSVTVTDEAVTVEASAEARLERIDGIVEQALGGPELLVEHRTPLWRAVADLDRYGVAGDPETLRHDPAAGALALMAELAGHGWQDGLAVPEQAPRLA